MGKFIGRLLCQYGFHHFKVIDKEFDFNLGGGVEVVQCRRCQLMFRR